MKKYTKFLPFLLLGLCLVLSSCSNEESIEDMSKSQNIAISSLDEFNNAVHEASKKNGIQNNIDFVEKIILQDYNFLKKALISPEYDFLSLETFKINHLGIPAGQVHVGSISETDMVVYHESIDGSIDTVFKITLNDLGNGYYETSLINLSISKMDRETCEQQTEDGLKVVAIFAGTTSWWCPPCAFSAGITGAMLAAGNLSCRFVYD